MGDRRAPELISLLVQALLSKAEQLRNKYHAEVVLLTERCIFPGLRGRELLSGIASSERLWEFKSRERVVSMR